MIWQQHKLFLYVILCSMGSRCSWCGRAFACSALRCLRVSLVAEFCTCWSTLSLGSGMFGRNSTRFKNRLSRTNTLIFQTRPGHGHWTRREIGHGAMSPTVQTWTCESGFNVFMGNSFRTIPVLCLVNTALNSTLPNGLEVRTLRKAMRVHCRSVEPSAAIREENATTQSTS